MVVHDEQGNVDEKLQQISNFSYELISYFVLNKEVWWAEYFAPLENLISETRKNTPANQQIFEELHHAQWELDMFKKYPEHSNSAYFVIKKN